jgi:hypothetical protein
MWAAGKVSYYFTSEVGNVLDIRSIDLGCAADSTCYRWNDCGEPETETRQGECARAHAGESSGAKSSSQHYANAGAKDYANADAKGEVEYRHELFVYLQAIIRSNWALIRDS